MGGLKPVVVARSCRQRLGHKRCQRGFAPLDGQTWTLVLRLLEVAAVGDENNVARR